MLLRRGRSSAGLGMVNPLVFPKAWDLQVIAIRDPIKNHQTGLGKFGHQGRNVDGVAWEYLHLQALRAVLHAAFIVGKIPGADEEQACVAAALRKLFIGPKFRFDGAYPSHLTPRKPTRTKNRTCDSTIPRAP